jgi:hypothetical protein
VAGEDHGPAIAGGPAEDSNALPVANAITAGHTCGDPSHGFAPSAGAPYGGGGSAADPAAALRTDDVAYPTLSAIGNGVFSGREHIAALAADTGRRAARYGWRAKHVGLSLCRARGDGEKTNGED